MTFWVCDVPTGGRSSHHRLAAFRAQTVLSIERQTPHSPTMIRRRGEHGVRRACGVAGEDGSGARLADAICFSGLVSLPTLSRTRTEEGTTQKAGECHRKGSSGGFSVSEGQENY